jgi:hypothetical protein
MGNIIPSVTSLCHSPSRRTSKRDFKITPAERARREAGFSLEEAAKRLRLSPRYWRNIELHGGADIPLARRAAKLFSCDGNVFIFSPKYLHQLDQSAPRTGSTPGKNARASTPAQSGKRYCRPQPPVLALVPSVNSLRETSPGVAR